MSVDDFVISYFTGGSSASTLAMEIYSMARRRVSPEINAVSTLLFVVVLALLAVNNSGSRGRQRRQRPDGNTKAPKRYRLSGKGFFVLFRSFGRLA